MKETETRAVGEAVKNDKNDKADKAAYYRKYYQEHKAERIAAQQRYWEKRIARQKQKEGRQDV